MGRDLLMCVGRHPAMFMGRDLPAFVRVHLLIAVCLAGVSCATVPLEKDAAFSYAVDAIDRDAYADAVNGAWNFVSVADPDDPRYDRGLRLLASSLEKLELRWAAGVLYRSIAKARRNMALVPDAIAGLERLSRLEAFDEDTFVTSFVASEEFGHLEPAQQAFVDFYKGLDLARRGMDEWSERYFVRLPPESPYRARAEYVRAVRDVADGYPARATRRLLALRSREALEGSLARDVERSLARLAFDARDYRKALKHYASLRNLAPHDPEILLETAWTTYYLGDSRKTLGLLVALDAPVHRRYIAPERYLLEALALRRLCQFGPAGAAAVRLERRYAASLKALAGGTPPSEIQELRTAARLRGVSRTNADLAHRLVWERGQLDVLEFEEGVRDYLDDLYGRGLEEMARREAGRLEADLNALAEELLAAREGVQLIVHELGVALLRGRRKPTGPEEVPALEVPLRGGQVFFNFVGEYWSDELDDLTVVMEDRCIE